MPEFSYIARDENGSKREDSITAPNIKEASDILVSQNLSIIKITERDTSFDFMAPFMERFNLSMEKLKNRTPLTTLVFFTRQLSTMFNAGLTLEKAITFLSKEEKNRGFRKVLKDIERDDSILDDLLNEDVTMPSSYRETQNNINRKVIAFFSPFINYSFTVTHNNVLTFYTRTFK